MAGEKRSFDPATPGRTQPFETGPLGEGSPANVDIHKLGGRDHPEEDWGDPAGEGATYGANRTRRPERTEAERGQGRLTRQRNKQINSGGL